MWIPIDEVSKHVSGREMFVVKAFNVKAGSARNYTSDPWCVWIEEGKFCRWPHDFAPTHFHQLPVKD